MWWSCGGVVEMWWRCVDVEMWRCGGWLDAKKIYLRLVEDFRYKTTRLSVKCIPIYSLKSYTSLHHIIYKKFNETLLQFSGNCLLSV